VIEVTVAPRAVCEAFHQTERKGLWRRPSL